MRLPGRTPDNTGNRPAAISAGGNDGPPRGLSAVVVALTVLLVAQIVLGYSDAPVGTAPSPATSSRPHRAATPRRPQASALPASPTGSVAASPASKTVGEADKMTFTGPIPTVDTSTWYLVPDACLIAALELMDGSPGTAMTGSQAARLLRVMEEDTEPSQAVAAADSQLVSTAQGLLTTDQLAQMDTHAELFKSSLDVDALIDALVDAGDVPPVPRIKERPLPLQPVYSAAYMLAGLQYLNDTGALFADQATLLRPLVTCVVERRRARTATYRKATEILTQDQAICLVRFLAEMRTGQRALRGPSPDFIARLAGRASTP